jgi:hypothetical protein
VYLCFRVSQHGTVRPKADLLPFRWVDASATLVNPSFESHTNFDCAGLIAIQRGVHKHLILSVHPQEIQLKAQWRRARSLEFRGELRATLDDP